MDSRDDNDFTPLAYAVANPSVAVELLSMLIEAGADVNASVDQGKKYPLGLAACSGNVEATEFLLDTGASVNAKSPAGYTALIETIYRLHNSESLLPIIDLLVHWGADLDCQTDFGELPVTVASRLGRFDAVCLLLNAGAEGAPLNWSELARAVAIGSDDDVAHVLSSTGLESEWDRFGRTPGLLAATVGSIAKGQLLAAYGWNVNEKGRNEETAVMCCASANHVAMMAWLLDKGAEVDAVDDSMNTALILAAQNGSADCVRLLLDAGANTKVRNEYEDTAIEVASTTQVVRFLQIAGEDVGMISQEMKREFTGLSKYEFLKCHPKEYEAGKRPRYGNANPERMDIEFWRAMIRAGCSAYEARAQFGDTNNLSEPVWCFSRFGCSFTELPDGRIVQIAGEHEDYYDPDFCIYNDVIVHEARDEFSIYGYPSELFRPTDFHTATYADGYIFIVGCLGYQGTRDFGMTPIYRLSCSDWSIEVVTTSGDAPGWIYEHRACITGPNVLCISGGKVAVVRNGEETHEDLERDYMLDLTTMTWK
ncbi:MAG: ankyrin repeat domain-containing protein [Planctomycetales bacterium]|nr:ankyrin repeat domain-containing protein [Planctomycetales bacterium]